MSKKLHENYFPESDELSSRELHDTRRPKLTFKHVNRMRKIRELNKLERAAHREFVKTMYGPSQEGTGF